MCLFLQTRGFLGNPQAEHFDWLRCSVRVRGGASDLLVLRKKGNVTVVIYCNTYLCVWSYRCAYLCFRGGVFLSAAAAAEVREDEDDEGGLRCVQDSGVLLQTDLSV